MIAARRQPHRLGGLREQLAARFVGGRDRIEQFAVGFGIGADAVGGVARRLDGAGGGRTRSAALTAATSTWRSIRSSSGPETFA